MKILIFGKTGQVGQELISLFISEDIEHKSISRHDCDYTNKSEIESLISSYKPNIIINGLIQKLIMLREIGKRQNQLIQNSLKYLLNYHQKIAYY